MKGTRHAHPHVDPRQPRQNSRPRTNPPVFAFKPPKGATQFRLLVARDEAFTEVTLDLSDLSEPLHLPEKALAPGAYFWKWSAGDEWSEVFTFEIEPEAVVVEVPPADVWLARFPVEHPRLYIRPDDVPALRDSRTDQRKELWERLRASAEKLLSESHEIEEPPFLPDRKADYQKYFSAWYQVLHESRQFVAAAETLALAYLASGEEKYARAACRRMASISKWDPMGSSHIVHNDEAHMSVIWHGPTVCDWVWDCFTDEEREIVIDQFRRRGQINFEHMHDRSPYGITRFDSHAGREIVFLAQLAFVFHDHIPEAREWLRWLRPVLCGIWPVWAGDDGGWAEGPSYGLAYVSIMTMFATSLKVGADVDLYKRPFWNNHARWRQWCWPPYAEWMGFGDHTERWGGTWARNADLVETIVSQTGSGDFAGYIEAFRDEAGRCPTPWERRRAGVYPLRYLGPEAPAASPDADESSKCLAVFQRAGWAAIRTDLKAAEKDVALIFRSSPLGSVSHSHANHNDFILHVAGKILAMPSGYYDGYGSDHHTHWVWHTKSHNCVTLSDASQLMRSHDAVGAIEHAFEDESIAYMRGNGDAAYADRAERCRRHVVFMKAHSCFVMIDEFLAKSSVASALQWNMHSWNPFTVEEEQRSFRLEREGSSVLGQFMFHQNGFFSLTEGWDPQPKRAKPSEQWFPQHHLRFTTSGFDVQRNLAVILAPAHAGLDRPNLETERVNDTEIARIAGDLVLVNQGKGISFDDTQSDALAIVRVGGQRYEIRDGIVKP